MKLKDRSLWTFISYFFMIVFSLCAIVPFILLVVASFTDNATAVKEGFSFFPSVLSLDAYKYIVAQWQTVGRAYLVTILVTVVGVVISLVFTCMLAYALSKKDLPGVKVLNFLVIFTMLFNGGLVPTYMVYTNLFHIKNTVWALIFPNLLMNAFNIILVKNYFTNSIPQALLEAAYIDGASEFTVFRKIVLPLSTPILATIGLLTGITYWNDWQNGLYYLKSGSPWYSIQNLLNAMNDSVQYLAKYGSAGVNAGALPSTTIRMAIAMVGILPILVAYPFFQRYLVAGITVGAVKE